MLKELFTAALGMMHQQTRQEVTANNIANANTAGYKGDNVFVRNIIDARANFFNTPGDVEQNDPPVGSYFDMSAGPYRYTNGSTDLSIEGHGFFVVQDAEGKQFFTRAGNFEISKDGHLITKDGKLVMGETGPVNLSEYLYSKPFVTEDAKNMDLKINEYGEVFVNNQEADRLLLADMTDYRHLQRISKNTYIPTWQGQVNYLEKGESTIRQGWIEDSNVNIVTEMVEMIELQRMFEAGSKVIHTNNETLDKAIGIGKWFS